MSIFFITNILSKNICKINTNEVAMADPIIPNNGTKSRLSATFAENKRNKKTDCIPGLPV